MKFLKTIYDLGRKSNPNEYYANLSKEQLEETLVILKSSKVKLLLLGDIGSSDLYWISFRIDQCNKLMRRYIKS